MVSDRDQILPLHHGEPLTTPHPHLPSDKREQKSIIITCIYVGGAPLHLLEGVAVGGAQAKDFTLTCIFNNSSYVGVPT